MLLLGFSGCRWFNLLVAWSCKSAFLVKYCIRCLGTRLFKHLKTRMHLCIFLVEPRFNQFSTQKVSFEVFFCNIIWAAQFCRRCNSLQHPSEISPHATLGLSNDGCKSEVYTCLEASSVRHDCTWDKSPSLLQTLLLTYSMWSFQERFSSKTTPK